VLRTAPLFTPRRWLKTSHLYSQLSYSHSAGAAAASALPSARGGRLPALIHSSPVHTLQALLLKTAHLSIHSSPIHTLQVLLLLVLFHLHVEGVYPRSELLLLLFLISSAASGAAFTHTRR